MKIINKILTSLLSYIIIINIGFSHSNIFTAAFSKPTEHFPNFPTQANETRKILRGNAIMDTRPYMVYLRPASNDMQLKDPNWLCGGAIIHSQYILTSAACIENVQHFYVVSGTHRWIPLGTDDECITNGAKRAVWKCIPKNYVYDADQLDNIRWMINDIAVVKVEDDFNFEKRVRGCDFIPRKIAYNNHSVELERPGTVGAIAGWGSVDRFGDVGRSTVNSPNLQETDVVLVSKKNCKKRWPERYHYIIDGSMICAKDGVDSDSISQICMEQEVNCKELVYSEEDETYYVSRRFVVDPDTLEVHTAAHGDISRRNVGRTSGGFCENDHGGPLVVGHGPTATVIGVISACLTTNVTQKCYGPFLYTSVWNNRHLISCAIEKDKGQTCRKYLRTKKNQISETTFDWSSYHDNIPRPRSKQDIYETLDTEVKKTTQYRAPIRAHYTQRKVKSKG